MIDLKYGHNWNQTGKLPGAAWTEDKSWAAGGGRKRGLAPQKMLSKSATQPALLKIKQSKKNKKDENKNLNKMMAAYGCRWQIGIFWSPGFWMETCADMLKFSQYLPLILFL